MSPVYAPQRITLDAPAGPLRWLSSDPSEVPLGQIDPIEMWGLVGLAALARLQGPAPLRVTLDSSSSSGRFERTPRRAVHRWFRYEESAPAGAVHLLVRSTPTEDAKAAAAYAQSSIIPRITEQQAVTLNFEGIQVCTQSYIHALLYFPLRLAWAMKTPIYVVNAKPAVRSTLELLENYALGG